MRNNREIFEPSSYYIYDFSSNEKIKYYFSACSLLFTLGYIFYGNIVFSIIICSLSIIITKHYKAFMLSKRRRELNFQFRDLLFSISVSVSTGRQISEALSEANRNINMIYADSDYISIELKKINSRIINSKESIETILLDFSKKCAIEDITNFVDVILTCRKTGGDINKVIAKSCTIIMDKINVQKELETLTAQKKLEGKILTFIPIITILLLRITSPDYISILYTTIFGRIIMTVALVGIIISYALILKITQIEF